MRGLVKLLALAPAHRLLRDQVIEALWPETGHDSGVNTFYQALYNARRVFDRALEQSPQGLQTTSPFLSLKESFLLLAPDWNVRVDVEQFEAQASAIHTSQYPVVYQSALAWYRGDLLPEDVYEDWAAGRREALRQRCLQLLRDLAKLYEARQEYPQATDTFERLLEMENSDEEAHAGLMRLYARTGQRGLALRQYQSLREALSELNSEPDQRTHQLYEEIQSGMLVQTAPDPGWSTLEPFSPAVPRKRHNLPYRLSTFIGREKEIGQVLEMLRETRLLTITGAGGVGKTSLAIQAAFYLSSAIHAGAAFPDGIWLIELASLADPNLVPQTCAQTLELSWMVGQTVQDMLIAYLGNKRLLLILDNCEHLLDTCTRFSDLLLKNCPALTILTTSREPLGLSGETTFRLPSLTVPESGRLSSLELLAQVDSVRLFVERAGKVYPGFTLTQTNAASVAQISRRLDGIPLAIELAASRARMMTAEQIAARLDDAFQLLTSSSHSGLPRQQTLKATIDWSYDLLTPQGRVLLQRLSVFAGGWTMEAAEAVCSNGEEPRENFAERIETAEMLDLMGQLVDKSLVLVEARGNETRYRLLETIRQYARERLLESGKDSQAVRNRHLEFYARLTGEAEQHLRSKGQVEWLACLDYELDNLRSAMDLSRVGKIESGMQIAADLMWFWRIRSLFHEGAEWLTLLLAAEARDRVETSLTGDRTMQRARALRALSYLAGYTNRLSQDEQIEYIQESIKLLRHVGVSNRRELGISLFISLMLNWSLDESSSVREEMLAIFHQEQEKFYLSEYFFELNMASFRREELDEAEAYVEASLPMSKEIEDIDGIASRTYALGFYALLAGKFQKATKLFQEAIELCQKVKNRWFEAQIKTFVLWIAMAQGNYAEVTRLGEAALSTFRELNHLNGIYPFVFNLLRSAWSQGDYPQVMNLAREITQNYADNAECLQDSYFYSGRAALSQNNLSDAESLLKRAMLLGKEFNVIEREYLLLGWTSLFMKQGRADTTTRLLGALNKIYQRTALSLSPRERSEHDEALTAARTSLGDEAFERAWKEGQAMTLKQAIDFVLGDINVDK